MSCRYILFFLLLLPQVLSANIIIDEGGLYSGQQYTETVEIATTERVIFDGCHFVGSKTAIQAFRPGGANLEIRNSIFTGKNPNRYGKTQGRTVHINGHKKSITFIFEHNTGVGFRGILLQEIGNGAEIRIECNEWSNIQGRMSDGKGGYLTEPDPNPENSQFLMLAEIIGAEIEVSWNHIRHDAYASKVEDVINLFSCKGRSSRPVRIVHNLIEGAYPALPAGQKDYSGSGIQIEQESAYIEVAHNVILHTANTGLALSWASNCRVHDNVIISTGQLPDDEGTICQSWRGLLIGNPYWHPEETHDNEAFGNTVWYVENHASGGVCEIDKRVVAPVVCLDGNTCHDNLQTGKLPTRADELSARKEWIDAAAASGREVGYRGK